MSLRCLDLAADDGVDAGLRGRDEVVQVVQKHAPRHDGWKVVSQAGMVEQSNSGVTVDDGWSLPTEWHALVVAPRRALYGSVLCWVVRGPAAVKQPTSICLFSSHNNTRDIFIQVITW